MDALRRDGSICVLAVRRRAGGRGNCLPACSASTRRRRRSPAWSARPRSASRPRSPGVSPPIAVRAGQARPQGRASGRARQSRAGRIAGRGQGGGGERQGRAGPDLFRRARRGGGDPRAKRRDGRGQPAAGRAAGCARRRAGGAGLRQQAEARRKQRLAGQGQGRPRPQARPARRRARRADRRGARAGRRPGGARRGDGRRPAGASSTRPGWWRRSTARSASWSPNRARSCPSASRC